MDQIPDYGFEKSVIAHPKNGRRSLSHIEFIDWGLPEYLSVYSKPLFHFFSQFLFDHSLQHPADKLQVAVIRDVELYLVPDVRKDRPRVVVYQRAQHLGIRKLDDPAAGMISRQILAAKFPYGRIQVADVDNIAGSLAYLDPVAYPVRSANQNIDPAYEAGYGSLKREAQDQRDQTY